MATRYVPGLSLHDHVPQEGPLGGEELRWFARSLAEALQAVHQVGVLHRDVKPSNVLMEGRTPVLIDFGLARVADDTRLTRTGWLLGTPGYLAPEILFGHEPGPAADVHSWAATVAFAGLGRPPFGGGPSMAVMDRVRRGEHHLSGVPAPLRELLQQGLSPDPLDRPAVPEARAWLREQRERDHLAAAPAQAPEQWTMPFAPQAIPPAVPGDVPEAEPRTRILPRRGTRPRSRSLRRGRNAAGPNARYSSSASAS